MTPASSFLLYKGDGVDERAPRCYQVVLSSLASAGVQFCLSDARSMQRAFFCKKRHGIRALQVLFNRRVSKVELACCNILASRQRARHGQ